MAKKGKDGKDADAPKDGKATNGKAVSGKATDGKAVSGKAGKIPKSAARRTGTIPGPPPPPRDARPRDGAPGTSAPARPSPAATAPDSATPGPAAPGPVERESVAREATVPAARPAAEAATAPVVRSSAPDPTAPSPRSAPDLLDAAPDGTAARARRDVATAPARSAVPATSAAPTSVAPGASDGLASLLLAPVDVARRVLPERRLPFYLGVGALAVVGVVEWPVVLAAGMAWEALRRRRAP